jgi:hypothetical protein
MGLLIKLQNGDTALKSLKFGKDRPGGGDSGQPYIKNPILDNIVPESEDFLLRGGLNAPTDAAEDVVRLTKYMFDLKSPSGLLFTAKQNLLSRVSPKTEASKGAGYAGGALNGGVYTPLSTLAQAGVGFAGIHLNKQGIDPTGLINALSIKKYGEILKTQTADENRLVNILLYSPKNLNGVKGYGINQGQDIITYNGGPGSVLGIGKTHIRYADQRTGINNPISDSDPKYFYKGGIKLHKEDENNIILGINETGTPIITYGLGASRKYGLDDLKIGITENGTYNVSTTGGNPYNYILKYSTLSKDSKGLILSGSNGYQAKRSIPLQDRYNSSTKYPTYISPIETKLIGINRELTSKPIFDITTFTFEPTRSGSTITLPKYSSSPSLKLDPNADISGSTAALFDVPIAKRLNQSKSPDEGYLANLNKNGGVDSEGNMSFHNAFRVGGRGISNDFRQVNRAKRGFNDLPTTYDYIAPSGSQFTNYSSSVTLDKIYYNSFTSKRTSNSIENILEDLIPFKIGIINPTNPTSPPPTGSTTLQFRAYIDDLSDSYNSDWKSQTYMGRAEKFYKYNSFDRSISLGFTIVADNKTNLNIMYQQLNTLAASLAPTYTTSGYMTGNLHRLTIGNYVKDQVGIMSGLTYEIMDESPWEITEGSQLPLYIKVTGIKFTPIHNFRPESQFNRVHPYIKQ